MTTAFFDLSNVCRVCLTKQSVMQLAAEDGSMEKLFECASVQLPPQSLICDFCKNEVDRWFSFKQQVLKSIEVAKYIEEQVTKPIQPVLDEYVVMKENLIKVEMDNDTQVEVKVEVISSDEEMVNEQFSTSVREEVPLSEERVHKCDVSHNKSELHSHKKTHSEVKPKLAVLEAEEAIGIPSDQDEDEAIGIPSDQDEDNKYQCDLCHKSFISKNGIMWHKKLHSALKLDSSAGSNCFSCPYCPMIYEKKSSLVDHVKWKHNCLRNKRKEGGIFFCDICCKSCESKAHLIAHRRIHYTKKPYKCDLCKKTFAMLNSLIAHHKIHTGETPHVCEECGRGFMRKKGLLGHQNSRQCGALRSATL